MTKSAIFNVGDCPLGFTVLEIISIRPAKYRVRCECGDERIIPQYKLMRHKSCRSCFMKSLGEPSPHKTKAKAKAKPCKPTEPSKPCDSYLKPTWNAMRNRILNSKDAGYRNYGGRGLTLEEAWASDYFVFREWILSNLGERPLNKSLDRIDNDYGYHPTNSSGEVQLRWATRKEQKENQRTRISQYGSCEIGGIKGLVSTVLWELGINNTRWRSKMKPKVYKQSMSLGEAIEWCLNKTYETPPEITYIEKPDMRLIT